MATTLLTAEEMLEETIRKVSSSPDEWLRFLNTASRVYQYSFDDQLMIYAQRPNAVGCTSFQTWKKTNHYVKQGTAGIALIHTVNGRKKLRYIDTVLNTPFLMEIHGVTYNDEKAAGEMLVQACTQMKKAHADAENIGSFWGFQMKISYSLFDNSFYVRLTREASFIVEVKKDPVRNIERILTAMRNLPGQKKTAEERLEDARQQLVQAKEEVQKPFEKEEELKFIQARLVKVNAELDVGSDEEKIQKDGKNRQEEQRICL